MSETGHRKQFGDLLQTLLKACQQIYADRLVSVAVFGSVGRDSPKVNSDIDLLVVADALPDGRLKRAEEVRIGSPLFLDMVEDARILFDREGFLAQELTRLRDRLHALGARRVRRAGAWYWDLKPDYQAGEEFEL